MASVIPGNDEGKMRETPDATVVAETPSVGESRAALLAHAAALLVDVVARESDGSFRSDEGALAKALAEAGLEATARLLRRHVGPEPEEVIVDGERYRRVLDGAAGEGDGGSCRAYSPFGVLSIPRALYREVGQRGVKGSRTIGLLEKRAGIINGTTPRMAELLTFYDAHVPSRESERLMDLAGLNAPRRATLERKAGNIGQQLAANADDLLAHARQQQPLPEGAAMITIGMDRVNVPYEEPNLGGEKSERTRRLREKKPYQRSEPEPIIRAFHGDFVGSVSIRDQYGEQIASYTYGLSHSEAPKRLADWLAEDVVAAVRQLPDIRVSVCQDGARELWPTVWEALARPELADTEIRACVDFHHFSPRVRCAVESLWGAAAYPDWERRLLDEPGAVLALDQAVLTEFERVEEKLTDEQVKQVHSLITYLTERTRADGCADRRTELFDYAALRAEGFPIGSGPTEAAAKSVAGVRLKRSGDRWSVPGAGATLVCRAIALSSGRWNLIWPPFARSFVAEVIPTPLPGDSSVPDRRAA